MKVIIVLLSLCIMGGQRAYGAESDMYKHYRGASAGDLLIVLGNMKSHESDAVKQALGNLLENTRLFPDAMRVGLGKFNVHGISIMAPIHPLSSESARQQHRHRLQLELESMRWESTDTLLYGLAELLQWVSGGQVLFSDEKRGATDRITSRSIFEDGSVSVMRGGRCARDITQHGMSAHYSPSCLSDRLVARTSSGLAYAQTQVTYDHDEECGAPQVTRHVLFVTGGEQSFQSAMHSIKERQVGEWLNDHVGREHRSEQALCLPTAGINPSARVSKNAKRQEAAFWRCAEYVNHSLRKRYATMSHGFLMGAKVGHPMRRMIEASGGVFAQLLPSSYSSTPLEQVLEEKLSAVLTAMHDTTMVSGENYYTRAATVPLDYTKPFQHQRSIYYSLLQPTQKPLWYGNIKRYQLAQKDGELEQLSYRANGQSRLAIVDCGEASREEKQCVAHGEHNRQRARSWWNERARADGHIVTLGGAATRQPAVGARNVVVQTDRHRVIRLKGVDPREGQVEAAEVGSALHRLREVLVREHAASLSTRLTWDGLSAQEQEQVIERAYWLLGVDPPSVEEGSEGHVGNVGNVGKEALQLNASHQGESRVPKLGMEKAHSRQFYGAALRSRPLIINYDQRKGYPMREVMFVSANDGFVRAVDTASGQELSSFFPRKLLGSIDQYLQNTPGTLAYGIDGIWTAWREDGDGDGVIQPHSAEDFVYIYGGMGRGGNTLFGLDVTDPENPQLLFSVSPDRGGPFTRMGQLWAEPTLAKTRLPNVDELVTVLIFGGGYDPRYDVTDDAPGGGVGKGNQLYMVLAQPTAGRYRAGDLLWWSSDTHKGNHVNTQMLDSIVGKVRALDRDGDGAFDALFAVDIRGRVFSYTYRDESVTPQDLEGRLVATLGGGALSNAGKAARFFFDGLSVSIGSDEYGEYTLLSVGSGWRSHPDDTSTENALFAVKMRDGQLRTIRGEDLLAGDTSEGFRVNLRGLGEKVFGTPLVLDGRIFFTTYTPALACSRTADVQLYGVDIQTGNGVFDKEGRLPVLAMDGGSLSRPIPFMGLGNLHSVMVGGALAIFVGPMQIGELPLPTKLVHRLRWQPLARGQRVAETFRN